MISTNPFPIHHSRQWLNPFRCCKHCGIGAHRSFVHATILLVMTNSACYDDLLVMTNSAHLTTSILQDRRGADPKTNRPTKEKGTPGFGGSKPPVMTLHHHFTEEHPHSLWQGSDLIVPSQRALSDVLVLPAYVSDCQHGCTANILSHLYALTWYLLLRTLCNIKPEPKFCWIQQISWKFSKFAEFSMPKLIYRDTEWRNTVSHSPGSISDTTRVSRTWNPIGPFSIFWWFSENFMKFAENLLNFFSKFHEILR